MFIRTLIKEESNMRADRYTKVILTIIAACLVWMCVRDLAITPAAYAQTDRVGEVVKVQIVSIDESPPLPWETLPVEVR